MGKNAAYAAQYAEEAKEQMRMYGIPASVILAQAILESSNGQSQLSRCPPSFTRTTPIPSDAGCAKS